LLCFHLETTTFKYLWWGNIKIKLVSKYIKIWWERNALTEITQGSKLREKGDEMPTLLKFRIGMLVSVRRLFVENSSCKFNLIM
jgi:hypothetical protein